MNRRAFLKSVALAGAATLAADSAEAINRAKQTKSRILGSKSGFTLWQIPSQVDTIGNSYVLLTNKGRVVVMDGGMPEEAPFLRGFIGALGNTVDVWFISHPHNDHMGALNEILKNQQKMVIKRIVHSRFSPSLIDSEEPYNVYCKEFYHNLDKTSVEVTDLREPNWQIEIDGLHLKVLGVTNEEFRTNPYNNSSMIIRAWDKEKSVVFLGDAGVECGDKALKNFANDLNCNYLQMAHHGQRGCSESFYKSIHFDACLWPTPTWVWNNDAGKGINTHTLKTFDTRRWMDEIGIKEHHVSCLENLWRLD